MWGTCHRDTLISSMRVISKVWTWVLSNYSSWAEVGCLWSHLYRGQRLADLSTPLNHTNGFSIHYIVHLVVVMKTTSPFITIKAKLSTHRVCSSIIQRLKALHHQALNPNHPVTFPWQSINPSQCSSFWEKSTQLFNSIPVELEKRLCLTRMFTHSR